MKGLGTSVVQVLEAIYSDSWATYSGKTTYFEATNDGIGLPTIVLGDTAGDAFDRFGTFNEAAYDIVFAKLVAGTVDPIRMITVADADGYATALELETGLSLVKVIIEVR
jgi:basic membrane protein A